METFLKWLADFVKSDALSLIVAGMAGGAISGMVSWEGWSRLVFKIFAGGASAYFLTDLAIPLLELIFNGLSIGTAKAPQMAAYIMGLVGLIFAEVLIERLNKWRGKDV